MRTLLWFLTGLVLAAAQEDTWVEEEDVEEPYDDEATEESHYRRRREVFVQEPYEELVRVKRRYDDDPYEYYRVKRADYTRRPRQVHQYEVHEDTDDASFPSPPYEEMLAASAEHYHRVYTAPGAPPSARYLSPDVSGAPFLGVRPVPSIQFFSGNSPYIASKRPSSEVIQVPSVQSAPVNPYTAPDRPNKETAASSPSIRPVSFVPPASVNPNTVSENVPSVSVQANVPESFYVANHVKPELVQSRVASAVAEAPVWGPVPVAAGPAHAPVRQLAGADLLPAAGHHHQHHKHSHGHTAGGGHKQHAEHHKDKGGKSTKGFDTHHYVDKGGKGFKKDENHRKEYEEAAGKKRKHHDQADHKGGHEEEAHGHRGAHFDEKKGHKKGHKTKGYHNKYHKDEFHKEHKFYDDFHKSGEHHRYGKFHAKHASDESGKKKAHHVNAGHDYVERGKKGYSNKGHLDADHKGYKGKSGHEEHHEKHSDHAKKGGGQGGKQWGYAKKN